MSQCFLGDVQCDSGQIQTCMEGTDGCSAWVMTSPCPDGFCADSTTCGSCNNSCNSAGAVDCSGGVLRTCEADAHGCLAWSSGTACPNGFCADDTTCGSCASSPHFLWKSGSCAEVLQSESDQIDYLTATSDGLFWSSADAGITYTLVQLTSGARTVLATVYNQIPFFNWGGTLYGQGNGLLVKAPGQPLLTYFDKNGPLVYATPDHAWYLGPATQQLADPIKWAAIPPGCRTNSQSCSIAIADYFYNGNPDWPGSDVVAASDTTFFFRSQSYGGYDPSDFRRQTSGLFSMPITGGSTNVVQLRTYTDEYGPSQLVFAQGKLYILYKSTILRYDPATNAEDQIVSAPTAPKWMITDGSQLFYIDAAQNLMRVRAGVPEPIATNIDGPYPFNLALDTDYVYFTGDNRRTILRWKR
jgi:hypothetical protein